MGKLKFWLAFTLQIAVFSVVIAVIPFVLTIGVYLLLGAPLDLAFAYLYCVTATFLVEFTSMLGKAKKRLEEAKEYQEIIDKNN